MYGNWTDVSGTLSSYILFAASIVIAIEMTVLFALKALAR